MLMKMPEVPTFLMWPACDLPPTAGMSRDDQVAMSLNDELMLVQVISSDNYLLGMRLVKTLAPFERLVRFSKAPENARLATDREREAGLAEASVYLQKVASDADVALRKAHRNLYEIVRMEVNFRLISIPA